MQIETPPTEKPYDKPEGERRGLVIVNTGDGKGKSTAAFGLALRAFGRTHVHGKKVRIFQFMKVPSARFGEHRMFEQLGLPIEGLGDGFSWKSQDLERSGQLARDGWENDPFTYQDNRSTRQPSGRSWTVGITIPLPIYNRNQGNIARAHSNVCQSQVELAALERRVISEVRLAEREYRTSKQVLSRVETSTIPTAREARARATTEFAAGTLILSDYIDRLDDDDDAARLHRDVLIRHRRGMLDLNTAIGARILP